MHSPGFRELPRFDIIAAEEISHLKSFMDEKLPKRVRKTRKTPETGGF
jgi:hypothetical protein